MPPSLGRVAELWRHPVKSMQGEQLEVVELGEWGVPGDRRWAVIDEASGTAMSAKRYPVLLQAFARVDDAAVLVRIPGKDEAPAGDAALDAALSEWLGRAVHLEEASLEGGRKYESNVDSEDDTSEVAQFPTPPGTFLDAAAVHILSDASLAAMAAVAPGEDWCRARFRPTILLGAVGEGHVEDQALGSEVAVGSAVLSLFAPCVRCAMPGREQPGVAKSADLLRALKHHHLNTLGVYAAVSRQGLVGVGDEVVPAIPG
jgi:uncharacterized protein YcbX